MCGINGFISNKNIDRSLALNKLEVMNNRIIHRGPDEDGFFVDDCDNRTVAFAMRRLSIIDLSTGKQPIFSDDKQKVIVFNGEIYNYLELKKTLVNDGVTFTTTSDTEVILKLYEKYGVEAFKMLDGMFAFSILDKTINKVFITRDFFGEKPLYYKYDEAGLQWCSELKSLLKVITGKPQISVEGLNLFLQLTYIPAPFTIYEGIKKLEANHFIEYDLESKKMNIEKIHFIENVSKIKKQDISFEEAKNEIRKLVSESIASRSISDVPIGTFLSGGVDSSIVTVSLAKSLSQPVNTFSIGFDKKVFDETEKSRVVAELIKSNHHEFIIGEKDFEQDLDPILKNFDEPFADSSALPSYYVAHKTKGYVTVALTGDGGDEVFGGYNKYRIGGMNRKYTSLMPEYMHKSSLALLNKVLAQKEDKRGLKFQIKKTLNSIDYNGNFFYNIIKLGFNDNQIKAALLPHYKVADSLSYYKEKLPVARNLTEFREVDRMISLEGDMLVKVDRTSMLTSLESRAPFLNKKIWDFTNTLPEEYLIKGNDKKRILKKAFENDFPTNFLEKSKQGFGVPVGDWLKTVLKNELLSYIDKKFVQDQQIFEFSVINTLVSNHLNNIEDNTFAVWTYYCFQKWFCNTHLEIS